MQGETEVKGKEHVDTWLKPDRLRPLCGGSLGPPSNIRHWRHGWLNHCLTCLAGVLRASVSRFDTYGTCAGCHVLTYTEHFFACPLLGWRGRGEDEEHNSALAVNRAHAHARAHRLWLLGFAMTLCFTWRRSHVQQAACAVSGAAVPALCIGCEPCVPCLVLLKLLRLAQREFACRTLRRLHGTQRADCSWAVVDPDSKICLGPSSFRTSIFSWLVGPKARSVRGRTTWPLLQLSPHLSSVSLKGRNGRVLA